MVEPVFIAQQYKIALPLNVSKEDKKTLAVKKDTDFLISKVLYGVEEQLDSETPSEYENKNFKMETNNRIEIDNRIFAFTNKELEQFITEPIKEYLQGLVPMNFGNKKITSALNEDDFKCDMKTLKNDLIKYKSELKECLDFGIKGAGSNYLYADADPYDNYYYGSKYMDAIKYLYNTISLHPLEFVKAAREETYNVGIEDIPSEVDLEPMVKEINKEKNKFYFVYPPSFYKMVEECGLKEYNPYEGKTIKTICSPYTLCEVKNNPGFAPYMPSEYPDNVYKFKGYAPVTGHFRDSYRTGHKHAGVDFDGPNVKKEDRSNKTEAPVLSLIHATYIGEGNYFNSSFGRFIVFQSQSNKKHFFILAHLSETDGCVIDFSHNKQIYPGMIVGYVGNTGNCNDCDTQAKRDAGNGAHLHVQLIISNTYTKFFDKSNGTLFDTYNNCFNPFDYEDSYSNPIREEL